MDKLNNRDLLNLLKAYDSYIQDNSENNAEFGLSWHPISIEEFYNNEYQVLINE